MAHLFITPELILGLQSGTDILSIFSGTVTYVGFSGSGGYTVTIKSSTFTASYCHVSPSFLVYAGQYVLKGSKIATVGPKNVYGVSDNPYKDLDGNPTNRCYYWSSLTSYYKKRWGNCRPTNFILI